MKIAIVTGASSGIGKEFALLLAKLSGQVDELWVVARRTKRLEELRQSLTIPVRVLAYDLCDLANVERLRAELQKYRPNVTFLVNGAGYGKFGSYAQITDAEALGMVDVNCRALVGVTNAVLPFMHHGAHIIHMSSTAAFQPLPDMAVYAATKAFVASYSRALNMELRTSGITSTAVCAGWMQTEFLEVAKTNASRSAVNNFAFIRLPADVAAKALRDSLRGLDVSVYGVCNHLHRLAAKFLPHSLVMDAWVTVKRKGLL